MGCAGSKADDKADGFAKLYLAKDDPDAKARADALEALRKELVWQPDPTGVSPSALVLSKDSALAKTKVLMRDDVIAEMRALTDVGISMTQEQFEAKLRQYDDGIKSWITCIRGGDKDDEDEKEEKEESLEDRLVALYKPLLRGTRPAPPSGGPAPTWWSGVPFAGKTLNDAAFAYTQLNSGASEFLAVVKAPADGAESVLPEHFGIGNDDVAGALPGGETLASLATAGRLFALDLSTLLADVLEKDEKLLEQGIRTAPIALFYVENDTGALMPLAIRLFPNVPGYDAEPVFTPSASSPAWNAAKLFVNNAAIACHTACMHEAGALVANCLTSAMKRTVSDRHPVQGALAPFVNQFWALTLQFAAGMGLPSKKWTGPIQRRWLKNFDLATEFNIGEREAARGIAGLKQAHLWRDATKAWAAYEALAEGVVNAVYADDAAVLADPELQAWAKEIVASDAANVKCAKTKKDADGAFTSRAQLKETIATLAYLLSAGHGLDVSEYGWYAWPAAEPLSFRLEPPRSMADAEAKVTDDAIIAALPTHAEALEGATGIFAAFQNRGFSRVTTGGGPDVANTVPEVPHWLDNHAGFKDVRAKWFRDLDALESSIIERNAAIASAGDGAKASPVEWPSVGLKPTGMCLSIWT